MTHVDKPVGPNAGGARGWPFRGDSFADRHDPQPALDDFIERAADREELLIDALHIAGVGGWELDLASGELNWSEETYRIFGVSPDSFVPSNDGFYALVHPDDRARVFGSQVQSSDEGGIFDAEYRIVTPAGETRHLHSRAQVVPRGKRKLNRFLGVVQDISEQRAVEETLERERAVAHKLQSDLIHISRVSAMGAMASALAHELNQPLTAILNYASGLRTLTAREDGADAQAGAAVAAIHDNAVRAGDIIRHLRAMTMRGEISTAPVDVAGCVAEAADLALIGTDVPVYYAFETGLHIDADRIQIQQVVVNLVRNAVEALEGIADPRIDISAAAAGDRVTIGVADNGSGIAADLLPTVFDSFVSTKPEGMGIGLAISRTIVEAHGGRLSVRSAAGEGTVFTLILPRGAT